MPTKLSLLMSDEAEGEIIDNCFQWSVLDDGRWKFTNGEQEGLGYFVTVLYSGAHGEAASTDHSLHLGDVLGIRKGKGWRVKATSIPSMFDCYGIAMGWYEDSDGILVQITGSIKGIGTNWEAGSRIYIPLHGYGKPQQAPPTRRDLFPIGLAISETDMVLLPRLDI